MTQEQTIIERVQKLLEFQKGAEAIGSLEEAANAAEKVQIILLKYNLELSEIHAHEKTDSAKMGRSKHEDVYAKKNEGQWIYRLFSVIAQYNLCTVIYTSFHMENGKTNRYVNLIGTKENVQVVRFLCDQLESRLRVLERNTWNGEGRYNGEKRNAFRRAYFVGACEGIDMQLWEAERRAKAESEKITALVVQNKDKLNEAVSELFPYLKSGRRQRGLSANGAQQMGYQAGRTMQINKGVNGGGSSGQLE